VRFDGNNRSLRLRRALGLSHFLWQGILFGLPLIYLVVTSLHHYELGMPRGSVTLHNYRALMASPFLISGMRSILVSICVAVLSAFISSGTVVCTWIVASPKVRWWIIVACALVFFAGAMPRTYALEFVFSANGPLGPLWRWLSVVPLDSTLGVVLASLGLVLPLALIIMYAFRRSIPDDLLDCARDLGARELTVQLSIVLPLLRPALIVTSVVSFLLAFGDVVAVSLIGGSQLYTAPLQVLDYIRIDDWGSAAAASVMLVAVVVAMIALGTSLIAVDARRR